MTLSSSSRRLAARTSRDEVDRVERAEDYLTSIVDSSSDAIIANRLDGRITAWNPAAQRMFGYTTAEIIGKPVSLLFPPELRKEEGEIMARITAGRKLRTYDTRRVRKDGREIQVSITVSPIRNSAEEIVGASKIIRDITERKAAEQRMGNLQAELIHLARWNTMGMMASSLAHELNQPLAAMTNYLSALRRVLAAQPQNQKLLRELVEKAVQQGQRAATIVQHVRELVAKGKSSRRPESLAGVIREALQIMSIVTRQLGVEIQVEAENDLPQIEIDRVQIQQVIINLVRNAAEAMANEPERRLCVRIAREGDRLRTDIADTGPGLPDEVASHLFEAFISTKSTGMGLGLSICHQIVTAHGGRLIARPNEPRGTVFTFTLPLPAELTS